MTARNSPPRRSNAPGSADRPCRRALRLNPRKSCGKVAEIVTHGPAEATFLPKRPARKNGKFPGMAGVYNETLMPRYIEMGARFIPSRLDAALLPAAAVQRTDFLRSSSHPACDIRRGTPRSVRYRFGSRNVGAKGSAMAQSAAMTQNPCAPKWA